MAHDELTDDFWNVLKLVEILVFIVYAEQDGLQDMPMCRVLQNGLI